MNKEIFKDIPNYEGMYQVSNLGNVKSFKRYESGRILKESKNKKGYLQVYLSFYKNVRCFKVHQLIAMAFLNHIPNGNKLVVDHINNIKNDNNLKNLRVITNRENVSNDRKNIYSNHIGVSFDKRRKKWISRIGNNRNTNFLGSFDSELKASEAYKNKLKEIS